MLRAHTGNAIAGKAGYAVGCVLAAGTLAVSYMASYVVKAAQSFGGSDVITSGPSSGPMNILLMGLESRTDYDGNVLPADLLAAMHAGSVQGVLNDGVGGQDTNTMILIHVFSGGQRAVGFSIPRDDWVTFPKPYDGQPEGKIDQAYGLAWAQSLAQTARSGMSRDQRYLQANESGQAATIATVESVTGQHVDHFAEVNLAGFYELARVFGGVEVCLRSWAGGRNLHDANSGFSQPRAGYLHLSAPQALAFVRERDNLPAGDIDRTHRQQAVIDFVIWKLEHQGILTSLSQLTGLLNAAKRYVITDEGWQILDFASEMRALTGKNLTFETLPVAGFRTFYLGGQAEDGNLISVPAIRAELRRAFTSPDGPPRAAGPRPMRQSAPVPPASAVTVDVYNGGSAPGLAGRVSRALVSMGYKPGAVADGSGQAEPVQSATQVFYGAGAETSAAAISRYFRAAVSASRLVAAGHVEVLLGTAATAVPAGLRAAGAGSGTAAGPAPGPSSASPAPAPPSASGPSSASGPAAVPASPANAGAAGGAVTVRANAPFGIPCVY